LATSKTEPKLNKNKAKAMKRKMLIEKEDRIKKQLLTRKLKK
jgi:hypothetical protein